MEEKQYVIKIGEGYVTEIWELIGSFSVEQDLSRAHFFPISRALSIVEGLKLGEVLAVNLTPLAAHPLSKFDWISELKEIFDAKVSVPFDSFEINWGALYQSGWTPEEAAERAIEGLESGEDDN